VAIHLAVGFLHRRRFTSKAWQWRLRTSAFIFRQVKRITFESATATVGGRDGKLQFTVARNRCLLLRSVNGLR
jgi:hypothetical protein